VKPDLVVAGTPSGVVMVEAGANQLPNKRDRKRIDFGYEAVGELIKAQQTLPSPTWASEQVFRKPQCSTPPCRISWSRNAAPGIGEVLQAVSLTPQPKAERDAQLDVESRQACPRRIAGPLRRRSDPPGRTGRPSATPTRATQTKKADARPDPQRGPKAGRWAATR